MKIYDVIQGEPDWLALHIGIPTASEFHKIITPTGKLSGQAKTYAFRIVAEKLLNRTLDSLDHLEHIQRGKLLEPQAVAAYEFENEVKTMQVGFVTTDDGRAGASPDRFVETAGMLEAKAPAPNTQVMYLYEGFGPAYRVQTQGQLYVCEREWVDRYAYSTELPSVRQRSYRDEPFIRSMAAALRDFNELLEEITDKVKAGGFAQAQATVQTATDRAAEQWEQTPWGADLWGEPSDGSQRGPNL